MESRCCPGFYGASCEHFKCSPPPSLRPSLLTRYSTNDAMNRDPYVDSRCGITGYWMQECLVLIVTLVDELQRKVDHLMSITELPVDSTDSNYGLTTNDDFTHPPTLAHPKLDQLDHLDHAGPAGPTGLPGPYGPPGQIGAPGVRGNNGSPERLVNAVYQVNKEPLDQLGPWVPLEKQGPSDRLEVQDKRVKRVNQEKHLHCCSRMTTSSIFSWTWLDSRKELLCWKRSIYTDKVNTAGESRQLEGRGSEWRRVGRGGVSGGHDPPPQ
ncbi:hypothetical protein BSL78_03047 [Apostichopus japonicus]|uniref:EMI domain-containing protein n=1 Tax=Stichopus japonicus TaxID=307972 RepID=A0A2G8LIH3_STIJA|nr:hypothetical protein BSL78_03047 [Apostichopus japonicus]